MQRAATLAIAVSAMLLHAAAVVHAQQAAPPDVDDIFADFQRGESPGCAVGVIRDGDLVFRRGYGFANLDHRIPNGPDVVYYVGSVSKQFTAAAIALLADESRISLDDDVRRYIPELPDYGGPVTIRHLVHHTSGLRDIYTLMSLAGIRMEDVMTNEDALALIARQRELNFRPGDEYLYSNSGYWLLGQIIERVTGQTLRQYAHARIFQPLGMTRTHFHDDAGSIVGGRAMSYSGSADAGYRVAYLGNFDKVGAGGLYTTLADLAKWDANFYEPKVGGRNFIETMHTRGVLNSGDTIAYAFGINVQERRGLRLVRHGGSLMGFRADLVRYPDQRFSVLTTCNLGSVDAGALADRVTDLFLGDRLQPVTQRPQPAAVSPRPVPVAGPDAAAVPPAAPVRLADFAGSYYSEELDATYIITMADSGLVVTRRLTGGQPLRHVDGERFATGGQTFTFARDTAGRIVAFTVEAGRVRNISFGRAP
jgi:CubicO group peptidase (beta-lactamase class C family)